MMDKLKPCPFCGGEVDTHTLSYGRRICGCCRGDCILCGRWFGVEEWNSRPLEDALQDKVDALVELTKALDSFEPSLLQKLATNRNSDVCMPLCVTELEQQTLSNFQAARERCRALGLEV